MHGQSLLYFFLARKLTDKAQFIFAIVVLLLAFYFSFTYFLSIVSAQENRIRVPLWWRCIPWICVYHPIMKKKKLITPQKRMMLWGLMEDRKEGESDKRKHWLNGKEMPWWKDKTVDEGILEGTEKDRRGRVENGFLNESTPKGTQFASC